MPRARVTLAALLASMALFGSARRAAADLRLVRVAADLDDDDGNRTPDAEQFYVPSSIQTLALAPWVDVASAHGAGRVDLDVRGEPPRRAAPHQVRDALAEGRVRLLLDREPISAWALPLSIRASRLRDVHVQGVRAGRARVALGSRVLDVGVVALRAYDGAGAPIDAARSHVELVRSAPSLDQLDALADAETGSLRLSVFAHPADLPATLSVATFGPGGAPLDVLEGIALRSEPCPPDAGKAAADASGAPLACGVTVPVRLAADVIDRDHRLAKDRSVLAALAGHVEVRSDSGLRLARLRVGGPRASALGPIEPHRASLRVLVLKNGKNGAAAVGRDDSETVRLAEAEVARATSVWSSCGIAFRLAEPVAVVAPPRASMLAFGDGLGLRASGGVIKLRVDGRELAHPIAPGLEPAAAARSFAAALARAGFEVTVSDNARASLALLPSSDLMVSHPKRGPALLELPAKGALSTDRSLSVRIGAVDLEDGLQHFGDADASVGTVEERALIKAFDDGDPRTIEVFVIPSFGGGARLGESFIGADAGALRNVVLEDRAGVRADAASFTLAHELGHVLLDQPGHPDDYGTDTPERLMDSDAASATIFGPRRLAIGECERAFRQSGPRTAEPILEPWPREPLPSR